MTTPLITYRRPTKRDAEAETGEVLFQLPNGGGWVGCRWDHDAFVSLDYPWTHTPLWVDPGPDLKEQLEKDLKGLKECLWDGPAIAAFNRISAYVHSQLAKAEAEAS